MKDAIKLEDKIKEYGIDTKICYQLPPGNVEEHKTFSEFLLESTYENNDSTCCFTLNDLHEYTKRYPLTFDEFERITGKLQAIEDADFVIHFESRRYANEFLIYVHKSEIPKSSRLIRKFGRSIFITIKFKFSRASEETEYFEKATKKIAVITEKLATQGLKIGDKTFKFLFCNVTGSIRYIYQFVDETKREEILEWCFPKKCNETLYTSKMKLPIRISLLNSDSIKTVEIDDAWVTYENDVKSVLGKILTDGCGRISEELLLQVWEQYSHEKVAKKQIDNAYLSKIRPNVSQMVSIELRASIPEPFAQAESLNSTPGSPEPLKQCPVAIQIRYRGIKGMLVLDKTLSGKRMIIPHSMIKFISGDDVVHKYLEILGVSSPSKEVYLSGFLLDLFSTNQKKASDTVDDDLAQYITDYIIKPNLKNLEKYHCENYRNACERHFKGSDCESLFYSETLPASLLGSSKFLELFSLRFPIPKSCFLYGVCDYSKVLKEREVFIQFLDKSGNKQIITGEILLTKTPALFGCDLQFFKAVDYPELHHLSNVIVFSINCDTSPTELVNGDLDGDQFIIIYDQELISFIDKEKTLNFVNKTEESESAPQNETFTLDDCFRCFSKIILSEKYPSNSFLIEMRKRLVTERPTKWGISKEVQDISRWILHNINTPKRSNDWKVINSSQLDSINTTSPMPPRFYRASFPLNTASIQCTTSLQYKIFDQFVNCLCSSLGVTIGHSPLPLHNELEKLLLTIAHCFPVINHYTPTNEILEGLTKFYPKEYGFFSSIAFHQIVRYFFSIENYETDHNSVARCLNLCATNIVI